MPQKRTIPRTCEQCGTDFLVSTQAAKHGARFCSMACAGIHRRTRVKCVCQNCGKTFTVAPSGIAWGHGKYCSQACYWNTPRPKVASRKYQKATVPRVCEQCGKEFMARTDQVKAGFGRFCSKACHGDSLRSDGFLTHGYLCVSRDGKRTYLHRLIMEQHLGRPLTDDEIVHHINGDKTDNRPENLRAMTQSEHATLHGKANRWARNYDCCVECGTTKTIHDGHGLCHNCYRRRKRNS